MLFWANVKILSFAVGTHVWGKMVTVDRAKSVTIHLLANNFQYKVITILTGFLIIL